MNLDELVRSKRVLVCVGSGGVGKTTTSAVVGLHAALSGRKVLVMTIDPARRLANSLGLDALDEDIQRIDLDKFGGSDGGELWATMLDMKRAFDEIVERYTDDPEQQKSILGNRFYSYFSTSLAGAQELSASEKLYDVYEKGGYDLIVLDTPPTTNALDFLDAPIRFYDALDSAAFNWIVNASRSVSKRGGLMNIGTNYVVKTLGRFTGEGFFEDLGEFLMHFSALFEGFRERTRATMELFADFQTSFIIVSSPDPSTIDEAVYFRRRLKEFKVSLGGVVINRVRQQFDSAGLADAPIQEVTDALEAIEGARIMGRPILTQLARKLLANAHEFDQLAERDVDMITQLGRTLDSQVPLARVPMYATDVHTLEGLHRVRTDLFELD